jgi:hypothetical protein
MTDTEPAPDDLVRAALHYTNFADRETFEELCQRHGLGYAGTDEDQASAAIQGAHMWVANVADRGDLDNRPVDPLTLHAYSDPRDEQEREVFDGGEHRTELASGYASYVNIRGPLSAALELYLDVYETAEYIKGEFRPLATMDIGCNQADGQRVVAIEGSNIIDDPHAHGKALLDYGDGSFPDIVWYETANDPTSPAHHIRLRTDDEYRYAHEFDADASESAHETLVRAAKKYNHLNEDDFRRLVDCLPDDFDDETIDNAFEQAQREVEREQRREEIARQRAIPDCLKGQWEPDPARPKHLNARDAIRADPSVSDDELANALVVWHDIEHGEATDWVRNARSWAATQPEVVR